MADGRAKWFGDWVWALLLAALLIAAILIYLLIKALTPNPPPPPPSFASTPPADVAIPKGISSGLVPYFDDYSWRMFVAMVWPADPNNRGAPKPGSSLDDPGPRVFETYAAEWQTFQPKGAKPAPWGVNVAAPTCPLADLAKGDLVLLGFSKFGEFAQARGPGGPAGPLIAQNQTPVRYAVAYNRIEYDHIRDRGLYLKVNLGSGPLPGPPSPHGSILVKSAWMDMAGVPKPERYYQRAAWVRDLLVQGCVKKTVGLVGLHIVQKTPTRPQWIWSTFEHVDNIPDSAITPGGPFAFHDGTNKPMPANNPYGLPPSPFAQPFNVERIHPIAADTLALNRSWGAALAARNSVWRNYRLVMTQWPTHPNQRLGPTDPSATTPPGKETAKTLTTFSNSTLETFEQRDVAGSGCISCHGNTEFETDFTFSILINAYGPPSPVGAVDPSAAALGRLRAALASAHAANASARPASP